MRRFVGLVALALLGAQLAAASSQASTALRIKLTLSDDSGGQRPVPRHALLISDNPPTTAPRRVITGTDGTVVVRLRAGNYTVESDEPLLSGGRAFRWTQTIEIAAGRDLDLDLTAANAEVEEATAESSTDKPEGLRALLPKWQDGIVAIWTPTARASGFFASATGLIITNQRALGTATTAEVQLSPTVKLEALVVVADRERDVAILQVDAGVAKPALVLPLNCAGTRRRPLSVDERVVALAAPMRGPKDFALADVDRTERHEPIGDFRLPFGGVGGPVFDREGRLVGLSSPLGDGSDSRGRDARIVPLDNMCEVMQRAEAATPTRPSTDLLPLEPPRPFPAESIDAAPKERATALGIPKLSSADFDVTLVTPVAVHAARQKANDPSARGGRNPGAPQLGTLDPTDFGAWSDYFDDLPAVLVVRVTPRLAEGFWTRVARGAALTQGMTLPPIKRLRPGFARLRAYCGETEVKPVHPFVLEQRVSESEAIREGLHVYQPDAFGPHCKSVRFVLSSEKEPDKQDTRTVDPAIVERIWQDFEPYRTQAASPAGGP